MACDDQLRDIIFQSRIHFSCVSLQEGGAELVLKTFAPYLPLAISGRAPKKDQRALNLGDAQGRLDLAKILGEFLKLKDDKCSAEVRLQCYQMLAKYANDVNLFKGF